MRPVFTAPVALSLFLILWAQSAPGSVLDGVVWKIALVPDKTAAATGAREFVDRVTFEQGKFSSAALAEKGFKPAVYRGDFEEREAEFEADQESETEGVAMWLGEVRGDRIVGRLQWKKKDGTNLFFNFTGTKASR